MVRDGLAYYGYVLVLRAWPGGGCALLLYASGRAWPGRTMARCVGGGGAGAVVSGGGRAVGRAGGLAGGRAGGRSVCVCVLDVDEQRACTMITTGDTFTTSRRDTPSAAVPISASMPLPRPCRPCCPCPPMRPQAVPSCAILCHPVPSCAILSQAPTHCYAAASVPPASSSPLGLARCLCATLPAALHYARCLCTAPHEPVERSAARRVWSGHVD